LLPPPGATFSRRRDGRLDLIAIGIEHECGVVNGLRCPEGRRYYGRELGPLEFGEAGENRHHPLCRRIDFLTLWMAAFHVLSRSRHGYLRTAGVGQTAT
jgi:hypothetical protein